MHSMIAIIPAAGRGTRMASVTDGGAKEALPLGRKTVLGLIIEEARTAVEEVVVINSPGKPEVDAIASEYGARVIVQPEMRGLAHAISLAGDDADALVLLGDTVMAGGSPVERMANLIYRGIDGAIAVQEVPEELVPQYGIAEIDEMGRIHRLREKPQIGETHSRWAVAARYAFSSALLGQIGRAVAMSRESGEIGLTEILEDAIVNGRDIKAVALQPGQERIDCGSPESYRIARGLPWA